MGVCTSKNSVKVSPTILENPKTCSNAETQDIERTNSPSRAKTPVQNGVVVEQNKETQSAMNIENNNSTEKSENVQTNHENSSTGNSSTSKSSKDERNVPELTNNSSVFQASLNSEGSIPKAVKFEVLLEENKFKARSANNPRRLKKLDNAPRLTAEQLELKLAAAEEKRKKELERKAKSGSSSSRRRKELLQAKELDRVQQQNQQQQELTEKLTAAERNRIKQQSEIVAKQRKHDVKVRRVRAKARQLHDEETGEVDFDVDTDDRYNAESDDEWNEGDNDIEVTALVHHMDNEQTQQSYEDLDDDKFFVT